MPDVRNRTAKEREFARLMSRQLRKARKRLMDLLGTPPDFSKLTPEFWEIEGKQIQSALAPMLMRLYMQQAEEMLKIPKIQVAVDWGLVNKNAVEWVEKYSFNLVKELRHTTQGILDGTEKLLAKLQSAFVANFEAGQTREELERNIMRAFVESIEPAFSARRASVIAVTETTRAATQGEIEVQRELREAGINMIAIWNTSNDEIVCNVCEPLNQKPADELDGGEPYWIVEGEQLQPPAHVNCRCWLNYELPEAEE